ncbi:hypothetical protein JCM3774_006774 [Rhodotorula dairenensis]
MALPRDLAAGGGANASRLSLASDAPSRDATDYTAPNTARNGISVPPELLHRTAAAQARYPIHAVLAEPKGSSSLLPAMPVLPSASSYLPSQLSSLSTTFTSAGTLPRSATPAGKSVAQRRAQAPPIQVSELRNAPKTDFDAYLAEIRDEYDRWQHEARLAAAEAEAEAGREGDARSATSRGPARDEVLPPLDDIPRIFFDSTFNLSNPRTFDLVTERIQLTPNASPNLSKLSAAFDEPASSEPGRTSFDHVPGLGPETLQDLAADQVLQDKLSHYTAVIESHLVREIGLRSSSFFAALSNLQALHQQGQDALGKIAELQRTLGTERGGVGATARHGLSILQAQARRRGLERIEESVRAVDEIWTAVEGVKELVENGEWDGALEVGEQIEAAYYASSPASSSSPSRAANGEERPSLPHPTSSSGSLATSTSRRTPRRAVNLTKLRALASLPSKLALLRAQIAKSLEGELVTVLEHELDTGIDEHVKLAKAGRRWKGKEREKEPPSAGQTLAVVREDEPEEEPEEPEEAAPETRARERVTDRIRPVVRALVRADGMDNAISAWRDSVLREIRALVREHLPTAETPGVEDDDSFAHAAIRSVSKQSVDLGSISEKSLSLAKKLRALSHGEFVALAQETYLGLLACIELVNLQAEVLVAQWQANKKEEAERRQRRRAGTAELPPPNATSSSHLAVPSSLAPSPTPDSLNSLESRSTTTSEDATTLATEITDVVHAVAELANVRFSKVIGVRTEVHAQLALADFVQIFDLSWDFVVQCERICQRMIVGLRGAMVAQAKTFLQAFHQRQITENARVVEEEQWAAVEVGPTVQAGVACIVQIAMSDPPELLLGNRAPPPTPSNASGTPPTDATSAVDSPRPKVDPSPAKQVDIEGKQFFAVSAGLTTILALIEYLKVLVNAPMLTTDVMSKIVEFMKVFNSRTCQVVLGAGAMRSAGLKNITAKHLALASQALSIMVSLIPYIREGVRRHLHPKQAVMLTEFDKLRQDYQEHQHEIHAKLIAIMSDRLHVHSRTLEAINWEEPAPQPGAPNGYMEALVKEHTTLHKVLSRFLQNETVEHIMTQVFAALDAKLADLYSKVELKSQGAQGRMLVDVRYLASKLGGLKSLEDAGPGKNLETLIQSKEIPRARPAAPVGSSSPARVATPTRSSSRQLPGSPAVAATETNDAGCETPADVGRATTPNGPNPSRTSAELANEAARPSADIRTEAASKPLEARTQTRDSTEDRNRDSPASSDHIPLPASSTTSTASSSPTIPSTTKKRKTLAERFAESIGRKAVAHAAVPATPSNSAAASTAERELRDNRFAAVTSPMEGSAGETVTATDAPIPQEILQEGLETPTLERTLALDVESDVPLSTPTLEELDAAEREIAAGQPVPVPFGTAALVPAGPDDQPTESGSQPAPASVAGSPGVLVEVEAEGATDGVSASLAAKLPTESVDEASLHSADASEDDAGRNGEASTEAVEATRSLTPESRQPQVALPADDGAAVEKTDSSADSEKPQLPRPTDDEPATKEADSLDTAAAESASIPQISITPAILVDGTPTEKTSGVRVTGDTAAPIEPPLPAESAARSAEASDSTNNGLAEPIIAPGPSSPSDTSVDEPSVEEVAPASARIVADEAVDATLSEAVPTSSSALNVGATVLQDEPTPTIGRANEEIAAQPEAVPAIVFAPPTPVVTSPSPTSPPPVSSPATSPPPANGTRRKTLKERLEEAARRRNSPSNSSFDDPKPSAPTPPATKTIPDHSASGARPSAAADRAAEDSTTSEGQGSGTAPPPGLVDTEPTPDISAGAGASDEATPLTVDKEEQAEAATEESLL